MSLLGMHLVVFALFCHKDKNAITSLSPVAICQKTPLPWFAKQATWLLLSGKKPVITHHTDALIMKTQQVINLFRYFFIIHFISIFLFVNVLFCTHFLPPEWNILFLHRVFFIVRTGKLLLIR